MSRFNKPSALDYDVLNVAGGEAFKQSPELELISILLTSFANDSFYEGSDMTFIRFRDLIPKCDKMFVAQAIVYARTQFGMRSISHVGASELARYIGGEKWASEFYFQVVKRPDDMMEILSYHMNKNGKISGAMKRGLAKAFGKFDAYQLGKYRGEGKAVKLIDVVNLVHPKPTEKNEKALKDLVSGDLVSVDTWEVEISKAGADVVKKSQAWRKLIEEDKLGYFALLRNLRNIIEWYPKGLKICLDRLADSERIKKSLVMPFRFLTAIKEIARSGSGLSERNAIVYLNMALDMSLSNVPKFEGSTVVVLDTSNSMIEQNEKSPHLIGALFAAVIAKANNCDFMAFDTTARYVGYNPMDSVGTIVNMFDFQGGGTNFHNIFTSLNKAYDRIIILSDMQGWIGQYSPVEEYRKYKNRFACDPFIYSFDLKNYGSMMFPEKKVFCLAGFSDKIFDIMGMLEKDKNAMINDIKNQVKFSI